MYAKRSFSQPVGILLTIAGKPHQGKPRKGALYRVLRAKGDRSVKCRQGAGEPVGKQSPLKRPSPDRLLRLERAQPVSFGEGNTGVNPTNQPPRGPRVWRVRKADYGTWEICTGGFRRNERSRSRPHRQDTPTPGTEVRSFHSIEEVG